MKVLVTGVTGFAGSHLVDHLLTLDDVEIYGIRRWRSRTENIEHFKERIGLFECDLRDASSVREVIGKIEPDRIFHLAAQSFVPASWSAPAETLDTNIIGELNIFEAARASGINPWIQLACSSEEYGLAHEDDLPLKETSSLRPLSPYGVSKVGQDLLGFQYWMSYGLNIVRTRGFNHTGPRRPPVFVCSGFARQIVEIEKSERKPVVMVGNLDAVRDFTDVRDMVRGYWLALEKGEAGEVYNISSGVGYSMRAVLDKLIELSGVKVEVKQEPAKMRPSDVPKLVGESKKFRKKTGWRPEIPFEQTLKDLLDFWRERV